MLLGRRNLNRSSRQCKPIVAENPSIVQKKSPTYWNVDVVDADNVVRHTRLRVQDVFATRDSSKVCTKWNAEGQPVGESAGLLGGYLGEVASNFNNFPIMYESWKKVPGDDKNNVYNQTIKAKFDVNDQDHKKYILASLGKKWRDTRSRVFNRNYNWEISVEENCRMHPSDIDPDHWRLFVQYRMSPKQMESSENEAIIKVFGKEHPEYVRGMGLGVTPTQIAGSCSSSSRITSSSEAVKGNQAVDLESPTNLRRSSESSHVPANDNGGSSPGTI
ncbi:hypothetical protein SESBI_36877 [Sesbania bispinosa]|nr:hypothetical protein SESBI_36877 [Sesbania bispinosa]